jgi:integrase
MANGAGAWIERRGPKWRVVTRDIADGPRGSRTFDSEAEARAYAALYRADLAQEKAGRESVERAIERYALHLAAKGNRASSTTETPRRLRSFFDGALELPVANLTDLRCRALYDALADRDALHWVGSGKDRELVPFDPPRKLSVDTCRNMLAEAKTFLRWCMARGWIAENPLEEVQAEGKRSHGKAQLRVDESRKWITTALELAPKEPGAVAALCALLLGMRASEIISRVARDLDDEGRLLWIPDAKTEAGKRTLEVPAVLQPHLVRLAEQATERAEDAKREGRVEAPLLFGRHWRDWVRKWSREICERAEVPLVPAHGLRGTATTIATEAGAVGHLIAAHLGHASAETTAESYVAKGVGEKAARRRGWSVLDGGGAGNPAGVGSPTGSPRTAGVKR